MDWKLSEIQQMVQESTREVVRKSIGPAAARADEAGSLEAGVLGTLAELGYLGACVPADQGGAELDPISLILATEEVARGCASTAALMVASNYLAVSALMRSGNPELAAAHLPGICSGKTRAAAALEDALLPGESGSRPCEFQQEGDRFRLSGIKEASPGIALAEGLLVLAREVESREIGLFWVQTQDAGVEIGPVENLLGLRASAAARLILEDASVPAERRLGGAKLLDELLADRNLGWAALAVGVATAAVSEALGYAQERHQFNRPILDFGAIRNKLADSSAEVEAARSLLLRAALQRDQGDQGLLLATQARLFATRMANRVAQDSLQVHGGYGYTKEYTVERLFRDARMLEIWGGGTEPQRRRIVGLMKGGSR